MLALAPALVASAPAPQDATAAVGRWKTETRNAVVEIQRCGASICGRILTSDALRTNPNLQDARNRDAALRSRKLRGLQILGGFKQQGNGWTGGKIYNAEDGKTYGADISLADANTLKLRGCVFKPLCKTQTWTRMR
ncbi:DUF2147 domain-containing protein [Sphingomonas sp. M1-B02]|uniref:DUF2147 domain-containing protein n=1 Tax=Sphingomonas sp. M1-B02 TaxID=3114300 RepID=UPI00223EDB31|nr:DUF2147 domain-containing protein [Sphingomonas sp. S6-11]UZK64853.1 DUF2147 domain-containing protein [Sphingomonas sp. S6-11]